MAKKKMTKRVKTKAVRKVKVKVVKRDGKRKAALILGIIAVAVLVVYSAWYFIGKETILTLLESELVELPAETLGGAGAEAIAGVFSVVVTTFAIIWLVLAASMAWTIYLLHNNRGKWYILLILGIIALLTGRWLAGIFGIVSSVLYKK